MSESNSVLVPRAAPAATATQPSASRQPGRVARPAPSTAGLAATLPIIIAALLLAGCGQKGPLMLPGEPGATPPSAQGQAQTQQPASEDNDDDEGDNNRATQSGSTQSGTAQSGSADER